MAASTSVPNAAGVSGQAWRPSASSLNEDQLIKGCHDSDNDHDTNSVSLAAKKKLRGHVIMVGGENNSKSCRGLFRFEPQGMEPSFENDGVSIVSVQPAKSHTWVRKKATDKLSCVFGIQ